MTGQIHRPAGHRGIRSQGLIRRVSAGQTAQSFTQRRPPARSGQARQTDSRAAWALWAADGAGTTAGRAVGGVGVGGRAAGRRAVIRKRIGGQSGRSTKGTYTAGVVVVWIVICRVEKQSLWQALSG